MAASKSTVGAVHFTLMFFVITTLGFGVAWYMANGERVDAIASAKKAAEERDAKEAQARTYFDQITNLKKLIGHEMADVGTPGAANPDQTTVIGSGESDLRIFAGPAGGTTYAAAIRALRTKINDTQAELDAKQQEVVQLQTEMLSKLDNRYNGPIAAAKDRIKDANDARDLSDKNRMEAVTKTQDELRRFAQEVGQLRIQLDEQQETAEEERRVLVNEVTGLRKINDNLRDQIDQIRNESFEQPDAVIRKVDHTTGLVWINVGTADDLPPRTSFSVYTKTHHGVGRGEQDIKGAIEVTRIIGDNLAEARILEEDYSSPISSGDPVYTPIWSAGRKHRFAVVGLIDFDDNDISDRDQFREIVQAAGGVLDVEVDDEGRMTGDGLTVHHKFLVMGTMPDPTLEIDPEKQQRAERIIEARDQLYNQARLNGVRVVSLDLFLEWAGYRPRRRLYRPGEGGYNLRGGATATGVDQRAYDFQSSGQTSKVYGNEQRLKRQKSSSGQTAKTFGGRPSGY